MAVCCYDLALFLMEGRWNSRDSLTENLISTEWPADMDSLMRKFGCAENRHRDVVEVEFAQLLSNDQHDRVLNRKA
jgi:hypothetical protein